MNVSVHTDICKHLHMDTFNSLKSSKTVCRVWSYFEEKYVFPNVDINKGGYLWVLG